MEESDEPITTTSVGIVREGNKVMKTITNLIVYFRIDENLKDLFTYNRFTGKDEYAKDFQWPEHPILKEKGLTISQKDEIYVQYYLAHNKHFEMPIEKIRNAI